MRPAITFPLKEWIPLGQAACAWAFRDPVEFASPVGPNLALEPNEIRKAAGDILSKRKAETRLAKEVEAQSVSIDTKNGWFAFRFNSNSIQSTVWISPWEVSALTHDETEAGRFQQRLCSAVGRIWRLMLGDFEAAIAAGDVVLHRRLGGTGLFEPLTPNAWRTLKIVDWAGGTAVAPDGNYYFDIHADLTTSVVSAFYPKGRGSKRRVAKLAIDALYPDGVPVGTPRKELCRRVAEWLKTHNKFVNDITILRAAGLK